MPFDLSTAKPVEEKKTGFDLSTAKIAPTISEAPTFLENLQNTLNWVAQTPFKAYEEGSKNVKESDLEVKEMFFGLNKNENKNLNSLKNRQENNYGLISKDYKYADENITNLPERFANWLKGGYVEAGRMLPMTVESIKSGGVGSGAGAIGGGAVGGVATKNLAGVIEGMKTGARMGGGLGVMKRTFELEAGFARAEFKEIKDKEGNPLPIEFINAASIGVGGVNSILEVVGLKAMLKTIPGGDKILSKLSKDGIKKIATSETVKAQLMEVAKRYGQSVLTESSTEIAQESTTIIAGELIKSLNGVENTPLEKHIARIIETGMSTIGATLFLSAPGSAASVANIYKKQGLSKKEAEKKANEMNEKQRAVFVNENSDLLVEDGINTVLNNDAIENIEKDIFDKVVNSGRPEKEAQSISQLISARAKAVSSSYRINAQEWYENLGLEIQSVQREEIENQFAKEKDLINTFNQPIDPSVDINQEIEVLDLSERFKQTPSKEEIKEYISQLASSGEAIPTLSEGWMIDILNRSRDKGHVINSSRALKMSKPQKIRHKSTVSSIDNLISNSVFVETVKNNKNDKKKNIENYHYFYTPVKLGKKQYVIKLVTEEHKKFSPRRESSQASLELQGEEKITSPAVERSQTSLDTIGEVNNIIPNENTNFKTVHLYDVIEVKNQEGNNQSLTIKEILKGVKDGKGNSYFQFAGQNAKTADTSKLNEALELLEAGEDNEAVRRQTGWFKSIDGKMRYEINDKDAKVNFENFEKKEHFLGYTYTFGNLGKVLEHNKLFAAYPELKENRLFIMPEIKMNGADGMLRPDGETIWISEALKKDEKNFTSTLMHEIQHAIQVIEGFAKGGSPAQFEEDYNKRLKSYKSLAGSKIEKEKELNKKYNINEKIDETTKQVFQIDYKQNKKYKNAEEATQAYTKATREIREANPEYQKAYEEMQEATSQYKEIVGKTPIAAYKSLAGEIEARNTADRKNLPDGGRRLISPMLNSAGDSLYTDALIIFDDGTEVSYNTYSDTQLPKGKVDFYENKNIISLFKNADESTIVHELGHVFLKDLSVLAKSNKQAKKDLQEVNKWLKSKDSRYTREQHEQFARGFEAYLMTGKAPTKGLKQAFENFKKWLTDIYESVVNLGVNLSPQAERAFDRLFYAPESYMQEPIDQKLIRKMVEQGLNVDAAREAVKQLTEKQQLDVLEEIEKSRKAKKEKIEKSSDDVFEEFNKAEKELEANEVNALSAGLLKITKLQGDNYINKIKLTEEQKKLKETAFDILSQALNKKKSTLKQILNSKSEKKQKQRENIEQAVENIEDVFSGGSGFLPEWKEFFNSANEGELNSDKELAQEALNVIYNPQSYFVNVEKQEANKTESEYKYILKNLKESFRTENQKQKDATITTFFDWLETIDSEFQEYFANKFDVDLTKLESDTGKDKFELIKEEVLEKANLLKNDFDSRKEYENVVKAGFDSIKFLTLEQRAKLINNILDLKTVNDLKAGINEVMELARIMESVEKRRNIVEKIEKQLKYSKNRKVGNKTVGKYDIATNKIFTKLRELNKLKQEEAREKLNEIDLDEESSLPFEDRVYNKFLYYKANGVRNTSTDLMQSLLEDVLTVKLVGRATKDEQQLQKKLNKQVKLNELLDILAEKPDKNSLKSGYIQGLANWESALNTIFNNNIKENYSLLLDESNTETWAWKEKQTFNEAAIKAYGVNSQAKLDDLIIDRLAEKYEFTEYVNERPNKKELNRMNIINIWIWNENTQLRQRLHNQYGVDQLKEMFSKLSIEDIKLALELMSTAEKFYKEANRIYIKKYGIELPRTQNYFPSRTERISEVDLLNDYVQASSSPSFIKSRVDSNQILMKEGNPVQTIYQHIDKMSRFINMTAKIDELNSIFKDPQMNRAISAKY